MPIPSSARISLREEGLPNWHLRDLVSNDSSATGGCVTLDEFLNTLELVSSQVNHDYSPNPQMQACDSGINSARCQAERGAESLPQPMLSHPFQPFCNLSYRDDPGSVRTCHLTLATNVPTGSGTLRPVLIWN